MDGLLTYLEHCEYATRQRALFEFLWYAGCRISGALALDLEDFRPQENHTKFRDSGCPHDRDTDGCEAAQNKPKATGCPSSKSLHLISFGATAAPEPISQWARRVVSLTVLGRRYLPLIGIFIDGDTPGCPVRVGPLFDVEVWEVGSQVTDCRPDLACSQIKILGNTSGLD